MKMIRFKPDCREWIKQGIKTTTFRRTKKQGIYEIVEGSWYHPKRLGRRIYRVAQKEQTRTTGNRMATPHRI